MTDCALSMNLAGLNVNGDEVTEVYAYYFQPLLYLSTIRTADIFLARGEDGSHGFMPGNAGHLPDNEKIVVDTAIAWGVVLDDALVGKKYRIVMVRLPEQAVTLGEETKPEQWKKFEFAEVSHNIGYSVFKEETIGLLVMYLRSLLD